MEGGNQSRRFFLGQRCIFFFIVLGLVQESTTPRRFDPATPTWHMDNVNLSTWHLRFVRIASFISNTHSKIYIWNKKD